MRHLPTTDLFFLNACGQFVNRPLRRGPVKQLGASTFAVGDDTVLLIRRDRPDLMHHLRTAWRGRLIYLIDDDIEAALIDDSLPPGYRQRLTDFFHNDHQRLIERANTLVVSSDALATKFRWHKDIHVLHPVWHLPPADDRHFADALGGGPIRAAHLGSGSHVEGVAFLRPVIAALIAKHDRFEFSYVGQEPVLGELDRHPRVHRIRPRKWSNYRRWIARQRFHLGLYPLPATPFHEARSSNKLLEYGAVGAVGIHSDRWSATKLLGEAAIIAGDDPAMWISTLSALIDQPARIRDLMLAARPILSALNDPCRQRSFWAEILRVSL